jgi:integrase
MPAPRAGSRWCSAARKWSASSKPSTGSGLWPARWQARLKPRVALVTAYAAGLRLSEVAALQCADIDSSRGVIRIARGNSLPPSRKR